MVYGYARVSTKTQAKDGNSLEAQENALRAAGAAEVYADAFSGTKSRRPELDKLLTVMQSGDTLKVTKLDRIARSATQGIELIQSLIDKGEFMSDGLCAGLCFLPVVIAVSDKVGGR